MNKITLVRAAEAIGKSIAGALHGPRVERSYLDSLFQAAAQGGTANLLGPNWSPRGCPRKRS